MYKDLTRTGIRLLLKMFFDEKHKNEFLAINSLQLQLDVGLYQDLGRVAQIIEEEQAFALLAKLRLLDDELVNDIELRLKGV